MSWVQPVWDFVLISATVIICSVFWSWYFIKAYRRKKVEKELNGLFVEMTESIEDMSNSLKSMGVLSLSMTTPWSFEAQRKTIEQVFLPDGLYTEEYLEKMTDFYMKPEDRKVNLEMLREAFRDNLISRSEYDRMTDIILCWNDDTYNGIARVACQEAGAHLWRVYTQPGFLADAEKFRQDLLSCQGNLEDCFERGIV